MRYLKLKSILSLSVVVMLLGMSVAYAVPDPTFNTWMVKRQTGSKQGEPVRVIKLVRYSLKDTVGTSIVSGDVVVYDTVSDDGISVRLTTTSADGAIAGIACTAISTSDSMASTTSAQDDAGGRNWGYIVVHGPANAKVSAGGTNNNSVGDRWISSTDSGAITTFEAFIITADGSTVANSNTSARRNITQQSATGGIFFDAADGTSTSSEVFVKLE